jgi:hypothetical protein
MLVPTNGPVNRSLDKALGDWGSRKRESNKTISQVWEEVSRRGPLYLYHIKEHVGVQAQLLGIPDAVFINLEAHVLEDESMWFCGNRPHQLCTWKWRGRGRETEKWSCPHFTGWRWDNDRKRRGVAWLGHFSADTEWETQ